MVQWGCFVQLRQVGPWCRRITYRPVKPKIAGSSPVGPATKGSPHQGGPFAFAGLRVTGLLPQCAAGTPDRPVVGGAVVQCYQSLVRVFSCLPAYVSGRIMGVRSNSPTVQT
jgi:hypothetical protein